MDKLKTTKINWLGLLWGFVGSFLFYIALQMMGWHQAHIVRDYEYAMHECVHYHRTLDANQIHLSAWSNVNDKTIIDNCGKDWQ